MRVNRLNEQQLIEIRQRKYLNELVDFCLYGNCLQEETARDYFEFLYDKIHDNNDFTYDSKYADLFAKDVRVNKNWTPPNPELSKTVNWTKKNTNTKYLIKKNPKGKWVRKASNIGEYYASE